MSSDESVEFDRRDFEIGSLWVARVRGKKTTEDGSQPAGFAARLAPGGHERPQGVAGR